MKTLEDLLRMEVTSKNKEGNTVRISPDFRIAVQHKGTRNVRIIIHPIGHAGDTLDFVVCGNNLAQF